MLHHLIIITPTGGRTEPALGIGHRGGRQGRHLLEGLLLQAFQQVAPNGGPEPVLHRPLWRWVGGRLTG